jgi:hypothetical protein
VAAPVSKLIRIVSVVVCLIAAASFLLFVVNQTSTASGHQQEELTGQPASGHATSTTSTGTQTQSGSSTSNESGARKQLDEVNETLTAPVSSLTSSSSEWGSRGLRLIFALIVYGFGLGYLARVLRVRV